MRLALGGLSGGLGRRSWVLSLVPSRPRVDTWPFSFSSFTLFETVIVVSWLVPHASHDIVNVWAPFRVVWSISSASSEAEFVVRHEVVPLVDTLVLSSVSSGVYETSDWVTRSVGSVRI